jgi:hypothetical protein
MSLWKPSDFQKGGPLSEEEKFLASVAAGYDASHVETTAAIRKARHLVEQIMALREVED